jgi:hypothetical protein
MLLIAAGTLSAFGLGQLIVLVPLMLYLGVHPSLLPGPPAARCRWSPPGWRRAWG